jgi:hypothetical protein
MAITNKTQISDFQKSKIDPTTGLPITEDNPLLSMISHKKTINTLPKRYDEGTIFTGKDIGMDLQSYYDAGIDPTQFKLTSGDESVRNVLDYQRAIEQGKISELTNATIRGVVNGVAGAIGNTAMLLDIPSYFEEIDNLETNWLTEITKSVQESTREAFPIYKAKPDDFSVAELWEGVVQSAVEFGLPGGAITRGVGTISKFTRAAQLAKGVARGTANVAKAMKMEKYGNMLTEFVNTKIAADLGNSIPSGFIQNYMEGKVMAYESMENVKEKLTPLVNAGLITNEDLRTELNKTYNEVIALNRLNLLTDIFSLHGLNKVKNFGTRRATKDTGVGFAGLFKKEADGKFKFNWSPDNMLLEGVKEYGEEVGQGMMQHEVEYNAIINELNKFKDEKGEYVFEEGNLVANEFAKKAFEKELSKPTDVFKRLADDFFSYDTQIEGLMGFFGGGPQRIIAKIMSGQYSKAYKNYIEEERKGQAEAIKLTEEFFKKKSLVDEAKIKTIEKIEDDDVRNAVKSQHIKSRIFEIASKNMKNGTMQSFMDQIDSFITEYDKLSDAQKEELGTIEDLQKLKSSLLDAEREFEKYSHRANADEIVNLSLQKEGLENLRTVYSRKKEEAEAEANKAQEELNKFEEIFKEEKEKIKKYEGKKDKKSIEKRTKLEDRLKKLEKRLELQKKKREPIFNKAKDISERLKSLEKSIVDTDKKLNFSKTKEGEKKYLLKKALEEKHKKEIKEVIKKSRPVEVQSDKKEGSSTQKKTTTETPITSAVEDSKVEEPITKDSTEEGLSSEEETTSNKLNLNVGQVIKVNDGIPTKVIEVTDKGYKTKNVLGEEGFIPFEFDGTVDIYKDEKEIKEQQEKKERESKGAKEIIEAKKKKEGKEEKEESTSPPPANENITSPEQEFIDDQGEASIPPESSEPTEKTPEIRVWTYDKSEGNPLVWRSASFETSEPTIQQIVNTIFLERQTTNLDDYRLRVRVVDNKTYSQEIEVTEDNFEELLKNGAIQAVFEKKDGTPIVVEIMGKKGEKIRETPKVFISLSETAKEERYKILQALKEKKEVFYENLKKGRGSIKLNTANNIPLQDILSLLNYDDIKDIIIFEKGKPNPYIRTTTANGTTIDHVITRREMNSDEKIFLAGLLTEMANENLKTARMGQLYDAIEKNEKLKAIKNIVDVMGGKDALLSKVFHALVYSSKEGGIQLDKKNHKIKISRSNVDISYKQIRKNKSALFAAFKELLIDEKIIFHINENIFNEDEKKLGERYFQAFLDNNLLTTYLVPTDMNTLYFSPTVSGKLDISKKEEASLRADKAVKEEAEKIMKKSNGNTSLQTENETASLVNLALEKLSSDDLDMLRNNLGLENKQELIDFIKDSIEESSTTKEKDIKDIITTLLKSNC